jgi:UPF0755 protein
MKKNIHIIITCTLLSVIILSLACNTTLKERKFVKIIIYGHETASDIAKKLHDSGIIHNTTPFLFWARILGYDKKIKAGRYNFQESSNLFIVLKTLSQGGVNKTLVTIPEGYNIQEIARLLESEGICSAKSFIKACSDKTLLTSLNINNAIAEGYLFPDSYDFSISANPNEIIERMVKRFWQVFNEIQNSKVTQSVILSRAKNLNSIDSIVTIASLVEKEAKLDNERPIIASVFYNRLKYNMLLQSCATVEYVLNSHKEQLSVEDTKIASPYNTYLHRGLPPTPICNPGQASLIAAINPAQTKYLYFAVDSNDSHHFSKSFSEHQAFLKSKNR